MAENIEKLRALFNSEPVIVTPCCSDALTARLIEQAGFPLTFMSGFCVSASRIGAPDTGLISSAEMIDHGRNIAMAISIPLIVDGDTGYGSAHNVKRTVASYASAGAACIMIEDQVSPKRCGHIRGKQVVDRTEAINRIRAAVDARDEGADILILGISPIPALAEIRQLGYSIVTYPVTLLMAAIKATQDALAEMQNGHIPEPQMSFETLQQTLGFDQYYEEEERYKN